MTMPGHDHTLWAMFHPDSLSNSTMVLNWICPVTDGESDMVHSTGEYLHSFSHSMDSCWWAYFFSPPSCPFDKLSVHSPLKGQVYN